MVKIVRSLDPIHLETSGIAYLKARTRSSFGRESMGMLEEGTNRASFGAIPSPDVDCHSLYCESLLSNDDMKALASYARA
ncbi:uncharacterized protein SCHCODRAFT_02612258 [Schizophyllum commune H4-8]|uniref:uncharacterized protein n=1 Tax=Schizophyllum commune (strain H4-8 / FGSC 9210) TaxID=578458 RepID=UPI00215E90B5|nr:uncharacterized protein SCHCODRAFT_02612258 [Schizophyllum commune H4-8]KAI5898495.1 hypothetical protein SCHCODRAFT_02612258 [Schizophyllum commune H4-8]